jgi:2-cysteine adaptor domain
MATKECAEWLEDRTRNPATNRKIKMWGATYKSLSKKCIPYTSPVRRRSPSKSPKKRRSPVRRRSPSKSPKKRRSPVRRRSPSKSQHISSKDCSEWFNDLTINPKTGRKIKVGGPVYQNFEKKCKDRKSGSVRRSASPESASDLAAYRKLPKWLKEVAPRSISPKRLLPSDYDHRDYVSNYGI